MTMKLQKDMNVIEEVLLDLEKPDKTIRVGSGLTMEKMSELIAFFKKNMSCFAWDMNDMPVIDP